ncbi:phage tail tape measure protein [Parabacteroides chinchillae]|uniref:Uncharacterized protein n=1 Tax=Parabacteroides chinchillae TaxID=871327 RepID=A0A8G2F1E3_9BACT|nr:phage tail tape measure protein [Parabacteroides chinchillae]SEF86080.1 hypothetical protein SAMN05444001_108105 [Parabacteroides chinchillae]
MANKKKKISELPLVGSLVGLYTIGVDAANKSVKVSLEWLKTATDNITTAISNATKATDAANTAAGRADKAAEDAGAEMTRISQEVNQALVDVSDAAADANTAAGEADQARTSLAESVQQKLTEVDNKMLTVKDGKTAQFQAGTNTSGADPSIAVEQTGVDAQGNPIYQINIVTEKGGKGDKGDTPVFEAGTATTGLPGTDVQFTLVPDGETPEGVQKYKVNVTVPQGMPGTGNVTAVGTGLVKDEKYLFVPSVNDESTGVWVKYIEPNNFPEAPKDGKQYARQDGAWSEIQSTGDGIIYPTFEINDDAHLIVNNITDPATFEVNESGHLIFNPQIQ